MTYNNFYAINEMEPNDSTEKAQIKTILFHK